MITTNQFKNLEDIYNYYNQALFGNELPSCMVNLSRKNRSYGFFAPYRWRNQNEKAGEGKTHEISINPDHMDREDKLWHSTLVHEMCHLWQEEAGTPPRGNYHNQEFSIKMESVGLITSDTGKEGGKRTGQNMTHFIKRGGVFEDAFYELMNNEDYKKRTFYKPNFRSFINSFPTVDGDKDKDKEGKRTKVKDKSKVKYTCDCGFNVWGKQGLEITCNACAKLYIEQE